MAGRMAAAGSRAHRPASSVVNSILRHFVLLFGYLDMLLFGYLDASIRVIYGKCAT